MNKMVSMQLRLAVGGVVNKLETFSCNAYLQAVLEPKVSHVGERRISPTTVPTFLQFVTFRKIQQMRIKV